MIVFSILCNLNSFERETQQDTYQAITRCDWRFPEACNVSEDAKSFVACLLCKDSSRRYTAQKASLHKWLDRAAPTDGPVLAILSTRAEPPSPKQTETSPLSESLARSDLNSVGMASCGVGAHRRFGWPTRLARAFSFLGRSQNGCGFNEPCLQSGE